MIFLMLRIEVLALNWTVFGFKGSFTGHRLPPPPWAEKGGRENFRRDLGGGEKLFDEF